MSGITAWIWADGGTCEPLGLPKLVEKAEGVVTYHWELRATHRARYMMAEVQMDATYRWFQILVAEVMKGDTLNLEVKLRA